jgi:crossover junction endodeoxyribonuclease RuvC
MGYGLISIEKNKVEMVEMGVLKLAHKEDHSERLHLIFNKIDTLIKHHRPTSVAIEAPFYGKNVQSMLKLGRAQGVAIAASMANGLNTVEYAPRKIKQSITGRGNASKEQVWKILQYTLGLDEIPAYMDASDAVAVALCHYYQQKMPGAGLISEPDPKPAKKKANSWDAFVAQNPDRIKK